MRTLGSYIRSRIVSGGMHCGSKVGGAVSKGLLVPAAWCSCADCGKRAQHYDHRDYNKPYDVDPVCRSCNVRRGKAIPKRWDRNDLLVTLRKCCSQKLLPHCRDWCLDRIESRVAECEHGTDFQFTRHELRPDVFGKAA